MESRTLCLTMLLSATAVLVVCAGCPRTTKKPSPGKVGDTTGGVHPSRGPLDDLAFSDTTEESGIDFRHRNGSEAGHYSILESLGGGVALFDYDGDGTLDLFFAGGGEFFDQRIEGRPSSLYRQLHPFQFQSVAQQAAGGFPSVHYSHGCFVADFDNDGFPDVLVTGYGGVQLWRNLGDGTFDEQHRAARLTDAGWSTAAGWGDLDGDGNLDLYIAHYADWSFENHPRCYVPEGDPEIDHVQVDVCPPDTFADVADTVWLSNGDGTFRHATFQLGLRDDGKGLGVALADFNGDGDLDIFVANDSTDNFLYLSDSFGSLTELGSALGVAVAGRGLPARGSGVDVGDFNLDGHLDLWVTNGEGEPFSLYRNEGEQQFLDISHATGMSSWEGEFVGFGTKFADLNRDGYLDLIFANGHVRQHPVHTEVKQQPMVLGNDQGRRFQRWEAPADSYFSEKHVGRGLATGDLNNRGTVDLVFTHNNGPPSILRNDSEDDGQWLGVRLIGRQSPRDGSGVRLTLETERTSQVRFVAGGTSYLSHSDLRPLFGFPAGDRPMRLTVRWPSGAEQVLALPAANSNLTLVEP
jgi:enediyne biosynthesis protein E4